MNPHQEMPAEFDILSCQAQWSAHFPLCPPLMSGLRHDYSEQRLAFAAFALDRPLLTAHHLRAMTRARCNMLAQAVFKAGAPIWVLNSIDIWRPSIGESTQTKLLDLGMRQQWMTSDPDAPAGEDQIAVLGYLSAQAFNQFNPLIETSINQGMDTMLLFEPDTGNVLALCTDTIDLFIPDPQQRKAIAQDFSSYLVSVLGLERLVHDLPAT